MTLMQRRRIQHIPSRRPDEIHLQPRPIRDGNRRVGEVVIIRKRSIRRLMAEMTDPLDVTGATGDDVHRRVGVIEMARIGDIVVDRIEALGVMLVAEDGQIDAVAVEEVLEEGLAGFARFATRRVPGAVAGGDEPGGDGAVDAGEVGFEEGLLLVLAAGEAVDGLVFVRGVGEVGLRVHHDDVRHAVFEGVPEGGVGEVLRFQGELLRGDVVRARGERGRHGLVEAVAVVGEVVLALRTRDGLVG